MKSRMSSFEKKVLIFLVDRLKTTYATLPEIHREYLKLYPRSKIGTIFFPGVTEIELWRALNHLKYLGCVSSEKMSYLREDMIDVRVYQSTKEGRQFLHPIKKEKR